MDLPVNISMKDLLMAFFLLLLPWVIILIGMGVNIVDVLPPGAASWYYILAISWFGLGVIFFQALRG